MKWIPRETAFFALFNKQVSEVIAAAHLFREAITRYEGTEAYGERFSDLEHAADLTTHEIIDKVNRTFITPIDREDIYKLAHELDDVIDMIEASFGLTLLYEIPEPTPSMRNFAQIILKAVQSIEQAIKEDKAVLGVCLGSQLLAKALGARVTKGKKKEIGWYPVSLTEGAAKDRLWTGVERSFIAYHWHGDVFDLPRGAEPLASSALTPCQAFRYGERAYGFLFHMEVTEKIIAGMIRTFAAELKEEKLDAQRIAEMAANYLPNLRSIGKVVFSRWTGLVSGMR